MLKGSTRIELKNAASGEVTVAEDNNTVTKGLEWVLKSYGVFNSSIFSIANARNMPYWKNILGGILLFEDGIPYLAAEGNETEYTETFWPPASAKMVANASTLYKTVKENPKELGIFNEKESGVQADGSVKFVYDWDTSHGNGTIGSVCLTSCVGGYEGYGNPSGETETENTLFINTGYISSSNEISNSLTKNRQFALMKADMKAGTAFCIDGEELTAGNSKHFSKTGKLHIYRIRMMTDKLCVKAASDDIPYELYTTIDIPTASLSRYSNAQTVSYDIKTGKTYICSGVRQGYTIVLDSSFHMTEKKMETILNNSIIVLAYDGKLYINNSGVVVLDAESFAVVKEFEKEDVNEVNGILCDGILTGSSYAKNEVLINSETFEARKTNRKRIENQKLYIGDGLSFYGSYSNSYATALVLRKDPRYLATVNNLSSPVTKTAEKTMKITYTIREE